MQNVTIMFAKIVKVDDDQKLYRVKATVAGYTEQIAVDDLPWYFPFMGVRYLPVENDCVPVLIFNGNFSTGMYLNKVDPPANGLSDDDYLNYVELFKRTIDDRNVELSYTPSLGINFINGKGNLNVQDTEASMNVSDNQIHMTDKRIDLGTNGQATVLGDDNVTALKNALTEISTLRQMVFTMFNVVKTASSAPMLASLRIALTAAIPVNNAQFPPVEQKDMQYLDTIQSNKTFIE
jgi:hypothetical protein